MESYKKIAIFAGSGDLPLQAANFCKIQSRSYVMVGFQGQTPLTTVENHPHFWTHLGTVGQTLEQLKTQNVEHIIFAGAIKRPSLRDLKVDRIGAQWLAQIALKPRGDDQLLTFLSQKLEDQGYSVISLEHLGADLLMPQGVLTQQSPSLKAYKDIEFGQYILKEISFLDIGQAIVIQQQLILGIEAIEGTDELIRRTSLLKRPGPCPILIKIAKSQQDLRFDQPTVGLSTIQLLQKHGFQGLALQAHTCLLLDRKKVITACNEAGLFLTGIN